MSYPYLTAFATDVVTPEKPVAVRRAKFTPPKKPSPNVPYVISCDGALTITPCFTLTGEWDIKIDDQLVLSNVTESTILQKLQSIGGDTLVPVTIDTLLCEPPVYVCTPSGTWEFSNTTRNYGYIPKTTDNIHLILQTLEDPNTQPVIDHLILTQDVSGNIQLRSGDGGLIQDLGIPATRPLIGYVDLLIGDLRNVSWSRLASTVSPQFYNSITPYKGFCDAAGEIYQLFVTAQNVAAISETTYNYYNWYGNSAGAIDYSYVNNVYRMKIAIDGGSEVELDPYNFTPNADTGIVEKAMLEHFAAKIMQLSPDMTARVVVEPLRILAPAYGSYGDNTSNWKLIVESTRPFTITTPKQTNGTELNPQNQNSTYGFDTNDAGLNVWDTDYISSADFSGPKDAAFVGCQEGLMSPEQANYSAVFNPVDSTLVNPDYWVVASAKLKLLTFADIGFVPASTDINILNIYAQETPEITVCGYEIERPQ